MNPHTPPPDQLDIMELVPDRIHITEDDLSILELLHHVPTLEHAGCNSPWTKLVYANQTGDN